jgi:hypothetical protein
VAIADLGAGLNNSFTNNGTLALPAVTGATTLDSYEASNMQKGAGAAGAGYAKSWRGLQGVRFAKRWG